MLNATWSIAKADVSNNASIVGRQELNIYTESDTFINDTSDWVCCCL